SWSDCGLFLLSAAISLAGAATLEQPKELTVREGNKVTIQCSMKGDSMRYYTMSWYRQGPSGAQEWIYKEDGTYGKGFQDRFKIRDERSRSRFPL
ncbi:HVM05 protein, partial [Rhabdornis inornatus]|nr:HVM05 protein [Rhabdornis inornatus]